MELKQIKTSDLIVDNFNVRGNEWDATDDDGGRLVDSIKAQGVLEPLLIRPVKGQQSKYPKNKKFSIVCGNRRWRAAMEARLKTVPCVVRKDLNDIQSLGTSIQENLKRKSMDKIQTANGVGRMWDMLNGNRTYEQKIKEMNKLFGMQERAIRDYNNLYRLSMEISLTGPRTGKIDIANLSKIQTAKHWDKIDKEKAIEVLSGIEGKDERSITLAELKRKTKEDEYLDVEEAHRRYVDEVDETVGESFDVYLNAKERKATRESARKLKLEVNTLIKRNHIAWMKREGYL